MYNHIKIIYIYIYKYLECVYIGATVDRRAGLIGLSTATAIVPRFRGHPNADFNSWLGIPWTKHSVQCCTASSLSPNMQRRNLNRKVIFGASQSAGSWWKPHENRSVSASKIRNDSVYIVYMRIFMILYCVSMCAQLDMSLSMRIWAYIYVYIYIYVSA